MRAASGLWQGFEDHAGGFADLRGGDGMAHAGVDAFGDGCIHFLKEGGGFVDAGDGDMGIGIACRDEDRRVFEVAAVVLGIEAIADESAGEGRDAAVAGGVAGDEFEGKAGTLREAGKVNILVCYPFYIDVGDHLFYYVQGTGEPGFVLLDRRHETIGVPGMGGGSWSELGEVFDG